jgi:hypothetical protein
MESIIANQSLNDKRKHSTLEIYKGGNLDETEYHLGSLRRAIRDELVLRVSYFIVYVHRGFTFAVIHGGSLLSLPLGS